MYWFMLLHSMHCSDPSRCWAISAQVTNCFLLCSCFSCTVYASGFCWSGTKCCLSVWLDRQTPSTSGHCGCKTGPDGPESTVTFQGLIKNTCEAVLLIRSGIHKQATKIHWMTDKPDRLKPKGSAKYVWISKNQELLHPQSALSDNILLALGFCVLMSTQ